MLTLVSKEYLFCISLFNKEKQKGHIYLKFTVQG